MAKVPLAQVPPCPTSTCPVAPASTSMIPSWMTITSGFPSPSRAATAGIPRGAAPRPPPRPRRAIEHGLDHPHGVQAEGHVAVGDVGQPVAVEIGDGHG